MDGVIQYVHLLAAGIVVGKVMLLSFVVAPILAKTLEPEAFGRVVRRLFPSYYALGIVAAGVGLLCAAFAAALHGMKPLAAPATMLWALVLTAELYCRSSLTPRSNAMRDRLKEQESRGLMDAELQTDWNRLHQRSVTLNSVVLLAGLGLMATTL
jgi:hypothetical protein